MARRRSRSTTQRLGRMKRTVIRRYRGPLAINDDLARPGRYEIKLHGEWRKTKSGVRIEDIFLIYELFDGTTGKVGPEDWRLDRLRRDKTVT